MTNKTPSGARKHRKGTKPTTRKTAKCFSFFFLLSFLFFLLSSDGLAQYCMTPSRWFTHETAAMHNPIAFFTTLKSRKALITTHSKTMASSLGHHFHSYLYACTLKDCLANETKSLLKIAELEIESLHIPGHGIEEPVYALYCQSNKALEKTEVGPYQYECI